MPWSQTRQCCRYGIVRIIVVCLGEPYALLAPKRSIPVSYQGVIVICLVLCCTLLFSSLVPLEGLLGMTQIPTHIQHIRADQSLAIRSMVADLLTGFAYLVIPIVLVVLVRQARRVFPFKGILLAFGLFIVACGASHLMHVWTLWHSADALETYIKMFMALVSVATAVALPAVVPQVLKLVATAELADTRHSDLLQSNQELALEIDERKRVETTLRGTMEQLQQERELLQTLMDTIPDAIYFKDLAGRFTRINRAQARNLGIRHERDAVGKTDADFFGHEHAEEAQLDEQHIVASTEPLIDRIEHYLDPAGRWVWISATKVPIRDQDGQITGTVGISRDITERQHAEAERTAELSASNQALQEQIGERRRAEQQLQALATQLQQSNHELRDFASVASHDLQEPLRKVITFGDRLRIKAGPALCPEADDYLTRMQNAAARMQVLINDLLTLAQVTTKARPFVCVDLQAIVRDVVSDLEVRIEQVGGAVAVGDLPTIEADPTQMRQLLQNLIGNALKFNRPGTPPRVAVHCELLVGEPWTTADHAAQPPHWQLTVTDNGIGFDEKYLDRIFAPFQRLHARTEYEGSGIGLAVCRRIAERHGGNIRAHSSVGTGSTFIVTLPIIQGHSCDE